MSTATGRSIAATEAIEQTREIVEMQHSKSLRSKCGMNNRINQRQERVTHSPGNAEGAEKLNAA